MIYLMNNTIYEPVKEKAGHCITCMYLKNRDTEESLCVICKDNFVDSSYISQYKCRFFSDEIKYARSPKMKKSLGPRCDQCKHKDTWSDNEQFVNIYSPCTYCCNSYDSQYESTITK